MMPVMFERTSSQSTWSEKDAVDNNEFGDAASTEGGGNEMVQETVTKVQADVATVMETEFYGIDSSLMLTLRLKLAVVSNSITTIGSPKSQPIINESSSFNAPLISVVEVKRDTLVAKITYIGAALIAHDSSPNFAPINYNSQQSQWQVFNMVNIPDKEKISTTAMKGNEPDQSNQPPHHTIWKPPPWSILKVNSDDAIFREQNSMGAGVVFQDSKGQGIAFMEEKINLFSIMVWKIWTHQNRVRTNQPCCSPNQLANMAKEFLMDFQAVQHPSLPQFTPIRALWRAPILDMVKVNFGGALFSREQKSGFGVVVARCFSKLHYSHVKREGNVAHVLARFTLNVSDYSMWMEDVPPQFHSCVLANFDDIH